MSAVILVINVGLMVLFAVFILWRRVGRQAARLRERYRKLPAVLNPKSKVMLSFQARSVPGDGGDEAGVNGGGGGAVREATAGPDGSPAGGAATPQEQEQGGGSVCAAKGMRGISEGSSDGGSGSGGDTGHGGADGEGGARQRAASASPGRDASELKGGLQPDSTDGREGYIRGG